MTILPRNTSAIPIEVSLRSPILVGTGKLDEGKEGEAAKKTAGSEGRLSDSLNAESPFFFSFFPSPPSLMNLLVVHTVEEPEQQNRRLLFLLPFLLLLVFPHVMRSPMRWMELFGALPSPSSAAAATTITTKPSFLRTSSSCPVHPWQGGEGASLSHSFVACVLMCYV